MSDKRLLNYIFWIFFFKIYWLCLPLVIKHTQKALQNTYYMDGVVTSINTPTYSNNITKQYLDEFNAMSNGGSVTYGTKGGGLLGRDIHISEAPMTSKIDIGETWPGITTCTLHVVKGLDYETYRKVLYHEYLHCFGYDHVDNKLDLMYYKDSYVPEKNIEDYSKDLAKRIKEWKNSKNSNSNTTQQESH